MIATTLTFLGGLGTGEVVLILAVLLLFFGAKKIPQMARGLGQGIREFKDASSSVRNEIERSMNEPTTPATSAPKVEAPVQPVVAAPQA